MNKRRYTFSWDLIGDIEARGNMGPYARVEVYRLLQFSVRDVLEQNFGTEKADDLIRDAGKLAGEHFYQQYLAEVTTLTTLVTELQRLLKDMGIGIFRVESGSLEDGGELILTVCEDLDCSGLPEMDHEFCAYDEGFIAGVLGKFTGRELHVRETDCWCTGDRTCRFTAKFA